ncbi:MAG: L-seryl-tRNA(Sec) selenium transferase [Armatimonadetes bacterium]|nr:L-seryl-tRNA(Sec) selenium transferase [Armatimonadota bacterium]
MATTRSLLERIPKIDRLLSSPAAEPLRQRFARPRVVEALRVAAEELRAQLLAGNGQEVLEEDPVQRICWAAQALLESEERCTLGRAINATGVVLHTGLGRAVLSEAAAQAALEVIRSHSLLEVDAESGERGNRQTHIAPLLRRLTGAEDALVVNNNAAAVSLAIGCLAAGCEVIVAAGQLVEIGGSFRIPDVIRRAGARLVIVGTTNKVRLADYAGAITPETALLLRVHPSNFRVVGFTEEASLEELVTLGRERSIPVMDDLGSGALVDLSQYGLEAEPTAHASVRAGADVVTFSGDKLLGGPQAGLIVGKREILRRMAKDPLMRVVRCDKVTLAMMEATLRLYLDEERALREIPTLAALTVAPKVLSARAKRLVSLLEGAGLTVTTEPGISQVGGGSLPGERLPTTLVAVTAPEISPTDLARRLRTSDPSIWARIHRDRLLFDLRTVRDREVEEIAAALRGIMAPRMNADARR